MLNTGVRMIQGHLHVTTLHSIEVVQVGQRFSNIYIENNDIVYKEFKHLCS